MASGVTKGSPRRRSNPMGDDRASGFAAGSLGGRHPVVSPVRTPVLLSDRRAYSQLDQISADMVQLGIRPFCLTTGGEG